uniref:Uncharacterized protein n=1 Tax=Rubrivivax gelatinosus S1 TaxID=1138313 RepID=L8B9W5_RUBGE|nr:hypothetical protein RGS1_70338 [Rubrivivax gelatinosus S1]
MTQATLEAAAEATPPTAAEGRTGLALFGGPGTGWRALAEAVWQSLRTTQPGLEGGPVTDRLPEDAADGHALLAFVEHPVQGGVLDGQADLESWMARWATVASRLLAVHVGAPSRCLLVELNEAQRAPGALAPALERLGLRQPGALPGALPTPDADPLIAFVADTILDRHPDIKALYQELLAACEPLDVGDPPSPPLDPGEALAEIRRRETWAQDLARRTETAVHEAREAAAARDEYRAAMLAARQDVELHRLRAGQLREELEQLERRLQHETDRAARAETLHETLATRWRLEQEERERQEERKRQEERERQEAARPDEPAAEAPALGSRGGLLVGSITVGDSAGVAPHRHLGLVLHGVRGTPHAWDEVVVRLIDHHGRAGMALFAAEAPCQLLAAWQPDGVEAERAYMLVLPQDAGGRQRLEALGSADWTTVLDLAALVRQRLLDDDSVPAPWRDTASRLVRQLDEMPRRLRYDGSECRVLGADVEVGLNGCSFGELRLERIELRLDAGGTGLHWVRPPAQDSVPTGGWPLEGDGSLAAAWRLPVGSGLDEARKRAEWDALPQDTRTLVLGALDALVAAAAGVGDGRLKAVACALRDDAHATGRSLRMRKLARRIVGRA